ncbi:GNAT family N-acetyltransferase [Pelagibius marinus]|uniref:GNAT family N-acetyltransferase n=1 Tax=Pelagibius marinus TaxID=2762760 RepID=UPI0018724BA9|nr:N-acetyltransferase [Pelagibius marinus]
MTFTIVPERPDDAALNTPLLDRTFGFERTRKTVYRLREGVDPLAGLCFSAVAGDGGLLGSIRYWPIDIAGTPAILLGPLAVEPALQGRGIGKALVRHSLDAAAKAGHRICVVVGDPNYYRAFGFISASAQGLSLPGPVEPERFQVKALQDGALEEVYGVIGRRQAPEEAQKSEKPPRRRRVRRSVA